MLGLSSFIGIIIFITGYYLAVWLDGSIAGAMATTSGLLFLLVPVLINKLTFDKIKTVTRSE